MNCREQRAFRIIHRELLLLVVIAVAAVPTYLFTRQMAGLNRKRTARIAAYWYRQGERQLTNNDSEGAISSLRHATTDDRNNWVFAFTLARALAAGGHDDEARLALLRLREAAPDNPQINVELARLAARNRDMEKALLYYHHALYGVWTGEGAGERRQVRLEMIQMLMDRKQVSPAQAELIAMSDDTPDTPQAHLQLAQLFIRIGDTNHALRHFTETIRLDPKNTAAYQGAGDASFRQGDYKTAERFLVAALSLDKSSVTTANLLETTRLIGSSDPLTPHLSWQKRAERLAAALDQSVNRLKSCMDKQTGGTASQPSELGLLMNEALALRPAITPGKLREDPENLRTGADLVFRIEEETSGRCGEPAGLDRALLLIGRRYKGIER